MAEKKLMKGNEAFAAAAINAGCRYYFGYPITPQSEVPEYMSRELKKNGGAFIQAESELGAINMAYGASAAGGRVLINGVDVRQMNSHELREHIGFVAQKANLFSGTIEENIRFGREDATDEEVIAAAKAAHAHHFIETLPGGYDFVLNEEATNVSQGQRQLLTIARSILADNPILILDEATSSVDTRTEQRIQKAMNHLMQGRTSFVIAHRLSTIKDADLILVMKDGDIIEQGSHEDLIAQNGFYAELYNSQFEEVG